VILYTGGRGNYESNEDGRPGIEWRIPHEIFEKMTMTSSTTITHQNTTSIQSTI